jgi:hypothetical protein
LFNRPKLTPGCSASGRRRIQWLHGLSEFYLGISYEEDLCSS